MTNQEKLCHDCDAAPGEEHGPGCDVEMCSVCGGQYILCGCEGHEPWKSKWDGMWPGEAECIERGWFARFVPGQGWQRCGKDDPGARPDLNRLAASKACVT